MINFEEELKKFHPSLELGETQEAIEGQDLYDVSDVVVSIVRDRDERLARLRAQAQRAQSAPVMSMGE